MFLAEYKWDLLAGVLPQLAYMGFTFAQPFLINRALDYTSNASSSRRSAISYGLTGAYALVYVRLAVGRVFPFYLSRLW